MSSVNLSDFPLSVDSLVLLLREGRDGDQVKVTDEEIANWCYDLFSAIDDGLDLGSPSITIEAARKVAYDVALQFEVDFLNSSGRVLDAELYQSWLATIEHM